MAEAVSQDQVVQAARELGDEFTRSDVVKKLGVKPPQIKDAFKAARQSGQFEKVGENAEGKNTFRLKE